MAQVTGCHTDPFALAQFFAVRDAFADQWEPGGEIEAAMTEMLKASFSLQMYLSRLHDLRRYSPSVIVNNGVQINPANQQVNATQPT